MTAYTSSLPPGRVTTGGLLHSEWTKLRTVRSTWWVLGALIVVGVTVSAIATSITRSHWTTMSSASKATFKPITSSLLGVLFGGSLILGVLAILVVSAEYGTGTMRATLAAAPRRPMVLAAKMLVFAAISLLVAETVSFASFFLGQGLLTSPAKHVTLASPGVLRDVTGIGLYLCVIGLFGLGIATLIRHTAGAISAYVGVVIVLPTILTGLPASILNDSQRYLPLEIGATLIGNSSPGDFSPWIGLLVLCSYAAAALGIGAILLVRRDA